MTAQIKSLLLDTRLPRLEAVSYTHLDVYKRQAYNHASFISSVAPLPGRSVMLGVRMTY